MAPAQGRVACSFRFTATSACPDGTPFEGDNRYLRRASRRALRAGYSLTMCTASGCCSPPTCAKLDGNGHPTTIPRPAVLTCAARQGGKRAPSDLHLTLGDEHSAGILSRAGPRPERRVVSAPQALEARGQFRDLQGGSSGAWPPRRPGKSFLPQAAPRALSSQPASARCSITKNSQNLFRHYRGVQEGRQFVAGVLRRAPLK
ncbi:MAG: hypothetical protein ACLR4Z_17660 [Butyricicoccaceae bacterium]